MKRLLCFSTFAATLATPAAPAEVSAKSWYEEWRRGATPLPKLVLAGDLAPHDPEARAALRAVCPMTAADPAPAFAFEALNRRTLATLAPKDGAALFLTAAGAAGVVSASAEGWQLWEPAPEGARLVASGALATSAGPERWGELGQQVRKSLGFDGTVLARRGSRLLVLLPRDVGQTGDEGVVHEAALGKGGLVVDGKAAAAALVVVVDRSPEAAVLEIVLEDRADAAAAGMRVTLASESD